jgi:hypothetical protein
LAVERRDVVVIQGGQKPRFVPEALQESRVVPGALREDLEGHVARQVGVPGAIDDAHPAPPALGEDLVLPDPVSRTELDGRLREARRAVGDRQQRLDPGPQAVVPAAGAPEERLPGAARQLERVVEDVLRQRPAILHGILFV